MIPSIFDVQCSALSNRKTSAVPAKRRGAWTLVQGMQLERGTLSVVVWEVPLRVRESTGVRNPGVPNNQVVEVEDKGEVVTRKVEPDSLTNVRESFRQGSALFSESS